MPLASSEFNALISFIKVQNRLPKEVNQAVTPAEVEEQSVFGYQQKLFNVENKTPEDFYQRVCVYELLYSNAALDEKVQIYGNGMVESCVQGILVKALANDNSGLAKAQVLLLEKAIHYVASAFGFKEYITKGFVKVDTNFYLGFALQHQLKDARCATLQFLFSHALFMESDRRNFSAAAMHYYRYIFESLDQEETTVPAPKMVMGNGKHKEKETAQQRQAAQPITLQLIEDGFSYFHKYSTSQRVQLLVYSYRVLACVKFFKTRKNDISFDDLCKINESLKNILGGISVKSFDSKMREKVQRIINKYLPDINYKLGQLMLEQRPIPLQSVIESFNLAKRNHPHAVLYIAKHVKKVAYKIITEFLSNTDLSFDYKVQQLQEFSFWDEAREIFEKMITGVAELKYLVLIADAYSSDQNREWVQPLFNENKGKFRKAFPGMLPIFSPQSTAVNLYTYALLSCGRKEAAQPFLDIYKNSDDLRNCINELWTSYFNATAKPREDEISSAEIKKAMLYAIQLAARMDIKKNATPETIAAVFKARIYFCLLCHLPENQPFNLRFDRASKVFGSSTLVTLDFQVHTEGEIKELQYDAEKNAEDIQGNQEKYKIALAEAKAQVNKISDPVIKDYLMTALVGLCPKSELTASLSLIGKVSQFFVSTFVSSSSSAANSAVGTSAPSSVNSNQTSDLRQTILSLQCKLKDLKQQKLERDLNDDFERKLNEVAADKTNVAVNYFLNPHLPFTDRIKKLTQKCLLQPSLLQLDSDELKNTPAEKLMILLGDAYSSQYVKLAKRLLKTIEPTKLCPVFKSPWQERDDVYLLKKAAFYFGNKIAIERLLNCYQNYIELGGVAKYVARLMQGYFEATPTNTPTTEKEVKIAVLYGLELVAAQPLDGTPEHEEATRMAKLCFCFFCHLQIQQDAKTAEFLNQINDEKSWGSAAIKITEALPKGVDKLFAKWHKKLPKQAADAPIAAQLEQELSELQNQILRLEVELDLNKPNVRQLSKR